MTAHHILTSAAFGAQPPSTTPAAAPTPRPITPLNDAPTDLADARPRSPWPARYCPACRTVLDGGPVRFRCAPCGKAVMAADLDTENRRPLTRIDFPAATTYGRAAA